MGKKIILYSILYALPFIIMYLNIFQGLNEGEFLNVSDQYLPLGNIEAINGISIFSINNFGVSNILQFSVNIYDRLLYIILYQFTNNVLIAEKIEFILKIILLGYFGLKIFSEFCNFLNKKNIILFRYIIALVYIFSWYSLIWWHGNFFSFTLIIFYCLAPRALLLIIYLSNKKNDQFKTYSNELASILFLISFAVYLYIPYFIFLIIIYVSLSVVNKSNIKFELIFKVILANLGILILMVALKQGEYATQSSLVGNTSGNINYGPLASIYMWYTWLMYYYGESRQFYTFNEYFNSFLPILILAIPYLYIIYYYFREKSKFKSVFLLTYVLFTFVFILSQPPLSNIYQFIVELPFGAIIRSPDTKISYILWLSIIVMLISSHNKYQYREINLGLFILFLMTSMITISGVAIRGENIGSSTFDRVVHIPRIYYEIKHKIIETNDDKNGFVLILPNYEYTSYSIGEGEQYQGQDMLRKVLSNMQYIDLSEGSLIPYRYKDSIIMAIENNNIDELINLGIGVIIFRDDIINSDFTDNNKLRSILIKKYNLVFNNNGFSVFVIKNPHDNGSNKLINIFGTNRNKSLSGIPCELYSDIFSRERGWIYINKDYSVFKDKNICTDGLINSQIILKINLYESLYFLFIIASLFVALLGLKYKYD